MFAAKAAPQSNPQAAEVVVITPIWWLWTAFFQSDPGLNGWGGAVGRVHPGGTGTQHGSRHVRRGVASAGAAGRN